jgi:ClpP class serine protease
VFNEDLNYTLQMFLKIVTTRPNINTTEIISAKMWYGDDAYQLNLIDGIQNIDDYLYELSMDFRNNIWYVVSVEKKKLGLEGLSILGGLASLKSLIGWD